MQTGTAAVGHTAAVGCTSAVGCTAALGHTAAVGQAWAQDVPALGIDSPPNLVLSFPGC